MASIFHGCARTTPRVRAELQAAQAPSRATAAQYGLNPKTVLKWRKRATTADAPMGPKKPASTVLTPAEEAIIVEFRRRTLLPLDDVTGALRDTIPNLSRSALHRCLQRHSISRLPKAETNDKRKRFKAHEIGYVRIDSAERAHHKTWATGLIGGGEAGKANERFFACTLLGTVPLPPVADPR